VFERSLSLCDCRAYIFTIGLESLRIPQYFQRRIMLGYLFCLCERFENQPTALGQFSFARGGLLTDREGTPESGMTRVQTSRSAQDCDSLVM
jgi:hypothetical protein